MNQPIYVLVERQQEAIRKITWQCLALADQLAGAEQQGVIHGVILGSPGTGQTISDHLRSSAREPSGTSRSLELVALEAAGLEPYTNLVYARAFERLWKQRGPGVLVMGHTGMGRDLAPRLAERWAVPWISDVTGLELLQGQPVYTRPIYAGKAREKIRPTSEAYLVSVRPGAFAPRAPDAWSFSDAVQKLDVALEPSDTRVSVTQCITRAGQTVELTDADYIVSGGIGVGGAQGFEFLRPLAETLGAALGASRAACNAGWINHQHQVGQTGKTVSPKLYIACGISGQIQHQAGIRTARCIVAINTDPAAPIFQIADYGIVADLFEVVPVLNEKLKKVVRE